MKDIIFVNHEYVIADGTISQKINDEKVMDRELIDLKNPCHIKALDTANKVLKFK